MPAYNEVGRLPAGLGLLSDKLAGMPVRSRIVVVDNASTDGTAETVRSWGGPVPVRLLRCERRGKGAAVRTGLLATSAPFIGFVDADMATDLAALDDVLILLREGRPVVIGSRRHHRSIVDGYAVPARRLGALTFNRIVRDLVGGIRDTQCGFKFFAGALGRAAAADLRTYGFSFDVELLAHCVRRGAEVTDLPVVWRDRPGSTFSLWRHSLSCFFDLARIRVRATIFARLRLSDQSPSRGMGVERYRNDRADMTEGCLADPLAGVADLRPAVADWRDPWHTVDTALRGPGRGRGVRPSGRPVYGVSAPPPWSLR